MGIFSLLFRGFKTTSKYGFYLGSVYTFFGFFYVQEIKHRLGDSQLCQTKEFEALLKRINMDQATENFTVNLAIKIGDIYTFYARTWFFREFEEDCRNFHKNVITSILGNYEEYGIFDNKQQMAAQIKKNEVNPATLTKILQVKELNMQLTNLYVKEYFKIVENQINLRTGSIPGVSEVEKEKINLIYNYIEKGQKLIFKNEEKYWEYKLMQSETKKHNYSDIIFKLIFI